MKSRIGKWAYALLVGLVALVAGCGSNTGSSNRSFTIALNPTNLSVAQGDSATTQLTLTPQNGFTGTVSLTLEGAPQGVSLSPTSLTVSVPNPVTQTLTLSTTSATPTGTHTLTLKASSGNLQKSATLTLAVSPRGGGGETVTVQQLRTGNSTVYYRTGGGDWQPLTLSGNPLRGTFTAAGEYEVAVRCNDSDPATYDVYLYRASTDQTRTISFTCGEETETSARVTFALTLPETIGGISIENGDQVCAANSCAQITNRQANLESSLPQGSGKVLLSVFKPSGQPVGYKELSNVTVPALGPVSVDANGWQPFSGARALPVSVGARQVSYFKDGYLTGSPVGGALPNTEGTYGLVGTGGVYLGMGLIFEGFPGNSFLAIRDITNVGDWTPDFPRAWSSGEFSYSGETLTFNYTGAKVYEVDLGPGFGGSGFIQDTNGQPLALKVRVYAQGPTTYTVPVVPNLGYRLVDNPSGLLALYAYTRASGMERPNLTRPTEDLLRGVDVAVAIRNDSYQGQNWTLP